MIAILKPCGGYLYDNFGWSKTMGIGVLASALGLIGDYKGCWISSRTNSYWLNCIILLL